MLAETDVIRYSTTTGVNAMITKSGSKIGLIVTKSYKDSLYADDPKDAEPVFELVPKDFISEVNEAVDDEGNVTTPLNNDEVLNSMQYLIDMGARAIVVSLRNSHLNPNHEKACKAIIKDQYPNFYLGSVRVFLASEVSDQPGAFARTNTVVANGYIHDVLVKYLYKAEDDLRANFCPHPLMVAHSHGGVARVAKTRAIDTYSSGPALGVIGAGSLGDMYGFSNVITVDIGGTSLDIGLIRDGACQFDFNPVINGFPISVPMITTHSAPVASGSIGKVTADKSVMVGPKSAGAKPGPVCFDLGGMAPTVTDADVVLGFIDPDYFLGGRIKLNKQKAEQIIKMKIADRIDVSTTEAAWMIREKMAQLVSQEILGFAASHGLQAGDLSRFTMVTYGGAGPTHYADFIKALGFGHSIATPYASVFSAYGASTTDLLHTYSRFVSLDFKKSGDNSSASETFNDVVKDLVESAQKDIRGEGFSPEKGIYSVELKGKGGQNSEVQKIVFGKLAIESSQDVDQLCATFDATSDTASISAIIVNAGVPMPHVDFKAFELSDESPKNALKTSRPVFWEPDSAIDTPIYAMEKLLPGHIIQGPAVVEGKDTTYVVPGEMSLHVDPYANIVMKG
jgi:N-methylhydantoinase A/acetophenone carboxylase